MAVVKPAPEPRPQLALDPRPVLTVVGGNRRGPMRPNALRPVRARLTGRMIAQGFRLADAAVLAAVLLAAASGGAPMAIAALAVGAAATWCALPSMGAYAFPAAQSWWSCPGRTAAAALVGGALSLLASAVLSPRRLMSVAGWTGVEAAGLALSHLVAWTLVRHWRRDGRLTPNVMVVGATENAARLIRAALERKDIAVLGVFDDRHARVAPDVEGVPVLGGVEALLSHRLLPYVDRIVVAVTTAGHARAAELLDRLKGLPNGLCVFVDVGPASAPEATLDRMTDLGLRQGAAADERRAMAKRAQDVLIAATVLVAAAPAVALLALMVRLDSPGPVLFRQRRHGFNNEEITVWKFRSMRADTADATAAQQVVCQDARVTRLGRIMRRTSLDELPQLFNVLRGEMSLVGPRPHAIGMRTAGEDTTRLVSEYAWRHRLKPGLTGWAQINGSRGPVHTAEEVRRRVELDMEYIERQSFWFDLYIMAMTLPRLLGDRETVR